MIKLDLDVPFDLGETLHLLMVFTSINDWLHLSEINVQDSKHGGLHVKIWFLEELTDYQVLAIQAILGSDPVRESFNFRRIMKGQRNWNILFEGKKVC